MGHKGARPSRGLRTTPPAPIEPTRVRRIPTAGGEGFSWIDRRFVRRGHLAALSPEAATLYLFLVTVADRDGLSYYGERRIAELTGLPRSEVNARRRELMEAGLLAFRFPLHQILALPDTGAPTDSPSTPTPRGGPPRSLAEILRSLTEDDPHGPGHLA